MPDTSCVRIGTRCAVLTLVALLGCGDPTRPSDIQAARQLWDNAAPAAYQMTLQQICFCDPIARVVVTVRDGQVQSRLLPDGSPLNERLAAGYPDVDGLFEVITAARARGAERLDVTYDRRRGFPSRIDIDGSFMIADDEMTYIVSNFRPL